MKMISYEIRYPFEIIESYRYDQLILIFTKQFPFSKVRCVSEFMNSEGDYKNRLIQLECSGVVSRYHKKKSLIYRDEKLNAAVYRVELSQSTENMSNPRKYVTDRYEFDVTRLFHSDSFRSTKLDFVQLHVVRVVNDVDDLYRVEARFGVSEWSKSLIPLIAITQMLLMEQRKVISYDERISIVNFVESHSSLTRCDIRRFDIVDYKSLNWNKCHVIDVPVGKRKLMLQIHGNVYLAKCEGGVITEVDKLYEGEKDDYDYCVLDVVVDDNSLHVISALIAYNNVVDRVSVKNGKVIDALIEKCEEQFEVIQIQQHRIATDAYEYLVEMSETMTTNLEAMILINDMNEERLCKASRRSTMMLTGINFNRTVTVRDSNFVEYDDVFLDDHITEYSLGSRVDVILFRNKISPKGIAVRSKCMNALEATSSNFMELIDFRPVHVIFKLFDVKRLCITQSAMNIHNHKYGIDALNSVICKFDTDFVSFTDRLTSKTLLLPVLSDEEGLEVCIYSRSIVGVTKQILDMCSIRTL